MPGAALAPLGATRRARGSARVVLVGRRREVALGRSAMAERAHQPGAAAAAAAAAAACVADAGAAPGGRHPVLAVPRSLLLRVADALAQGAEAGEDEASPEGGERRALAAALVAARAPHAAAAAARYTASAPAPFAHHELVPGADEAALHEALRSAGSGVREYGGLGRLLWAAAVIHRAAPGAAGAHWDWRRLHLLLRVAGASAGTGESAEEDAFDSEASLARYGAARLLARHLRLAGDAADALMGAAVCPRGRAAGAQAWAEWDAEVAYATAEPYLDDNAADDARDGVDVDNDAEAMDADGEGAEAPATPERHADGGFGGRFVDVCGVQLPRAECSSGDGDADDSGSRGPALVLTAGARAALLAAALALARRRPVLLEGPPGCGKSALVRELACRTGHAKSMAVVHLDDQMDSKSLLGTYACTKTPGEFVWAPGVLTQAVARGFWVVFEDIDLAPPEVITALLPLLEGRQLHLPGRAGTLAAHPGFQLFGTVSVGGSGAVAGGAAHERTRPLWSAVALDAPAEDDMADILAALHPELARVAPAVLDTLAAVRSVCAGGTGAGPALASVQPDAGSDGGEQDASPREQKQSQQSVRYGRALTVREMLALARRLGGVATANARPEGPAGVAALSTEGRELACREAIDVFAAHISDARERSTILAAVARAWGVPSERAEYFDMMHAPTMSSTATELSVGRASLTRSRAGARPASERRAYVRTGAAMRALERVARAASLGEPMLLVGETGVGKTASLTYLADEAGARLTVVNMSQQSDATDLLGGHKPIEAGLLTGPLLSRFELLFERTFEHGQNAQFLERSRAAARKRKWKQLFKAFRLASAHVRKLADGAAIGGAGTGTDHGDSVVDAGTDARDREPVGDGGTSTSGGNTKAKGKRSSAERTEQVESTPTKRQRKGGAVGGGGGDGIPAPLLAEWADFEVAAAEAEAQVTASKGGFAFDFVEGVLVRALREGHWVLLDEVNLAPAEALERLAGLLEGPDASLALTERGDVAQVPRHPEFRLFAAMNPATDVGKRELAPALRARFCELWCPEASSREDLGAIVAQYLSAVPRSVAPVDAVVDFYVQARAQAASGALVDGGGAQLRFSLRTLARSLEYAAASLPTYGLHRALKDGFEMAFLTALAGDSRIAMERLLRTVLLKGVEAKVAKGNSGTPAPPTDGAKHVLIEGFWVRAGTGELPPDDDGSAAADDPVAALGKYVLTASVKSRLRDLARAVLLRRYPVLLQGPTSAGKTSLVTYLAELTGHQVVRINNHEHTDLSEYLGTYVTDPASGKLRFVEGALVRAMRSGAWIVLDELNLAPSDVLEALNRLLDDNRELFVPELQEVVRPHPSFVLFATQNPPGLYGGRKVLSKAFRSRFMELHVDDIPEGELVTIVQRRCGVAPSYCKVMVASMKELQMRRMSGQALLGRHGAMTSRDLLRWARRQPQGYTALAAEGYMLMAERLRSDAERDAVRAVLEREMKAKIDSADLYAIDGERSEAFAELEGKLADARARGEAAAQGVPSVVWTHGMRRMFVLLERCMRHSEPALIVGETGCGKTTICQLLSLLYDRPLYIINCHQHTESSDFLGGFRPVRDREAAVARYGALASQLETLAEVTGVLVERDIAHDDAEASALRAAEALREAGCASEEALAQADELLGEMGKVRVRARSLFEWSDGPLVEAMRVGGILLVDEISIAEDSVLERLNSVLEPERTLMLAEKGGDGDSPEGCGGGGEVIVAHPDFRLVATMNPGGDFGKKELSPALRNRFSEVWAPPISSADDLGLILRDRLLGGGDGADAGTDADGVPLASLTQPLLDFWEWYDAFEGRPASAVLSVRDLLAWAGYIVAAASTLGAWGSLVHGAYLVLLDGVGLGSGAGDAAIARLRTEARRKLFSLLPADVAEELARDPALMEASEHSAAEDRQTSGGDGDCMEVDADGVGVGRSQAAAVTPAGMFGSAPFFIPLGPLAQAVQGNATRTGADAAIESVAADAETRARRRAAAAAFDMAAPTAARCVRRLLRALQLPRAVLLEGSPGVGKSSLVAAVAAASGHELVRINLSEQSDIMDLLGTDLPVEGGKPGDFRWCDGVLLRAVKRGSWVLLDELNLAPQAVLEGLNALLDHRAEVYIPELGRSFACAPGFRIFAAQNPLQEGGGRRGLPKSFLNRYSKVAVEAYSAADFRFIVRSLFPQLSHALVARMVDFNSELLRATMVERRFGLEGAPWEFNLRDLLRWGELATGCRAGQGAPGADAECADETGHATGVDVETSGTRLEAALRLSLLHAAPLIYLERFRNARDRHAARMLLDAAFDASSSGGALAQSACITVGPNAVCTGSVSLPRRAASERLSPPTAASQAAARALLPLSCQAGALRASMCALREGWMVLLVGGSAVGKTALARSCAALAGRRLHELSLTASTDTTELLGCFEQADVSVNRARLAERVRRLAHGLADASAAALADAGTQDARLDVDACLRALAEAESALLAIARADSNADSVSTVHAKPARTATQQAAQHAAALCTLESAIASMRAGVSPALWGDEAIAEAVAVAGDAAKLRATLEASKGAAASGAGRFEWVDGAVVRAAVDGDWLLLDNANLCNAAVLDRLNPLFEPNGELLLPERGLVNGEVVRVRPHSAFRVLLTADPYVGEPSRAMRNRGLEVCVLPAVGTIGDDRTGARDAGAEHANVSAPGDAQLDAVALLMAAGVPSRVLAEAMLDAHAAARRACVRTAGLSRAPGQRSLLAWAELLGELVARGARVAQGVRSSWEQVYVRSAPSVTRAALLEVLNESRLARALEALSGDEQSGANGMLSSPAASSVLGCPVTGGCASLFGLLLGSGPGARMAHCERMLPLMDPGRWPFAWSIDVASEDARMAAVVRDSSSLLRFVALACNADGHDRGSCDSGALTQLSLPMYARGDDASSSVRTWDPRACAHAVSVAAKHFMERACRADLPLRLAWLGALASILDTGTTGEARDSSPVTSADADAATACAESLLCPHSATAAAVRALRDSALVEERLGGVPDATAKVVESVTDALKVMGFWMPAEDVRLEVRSGIQVDTEHGGAGASASAVSGAALAVPVLARLGVYEQADSLYAAAEEAGAAMRIAREAARIGLAEERALAECGVASEGALAECGLARSVRDSATNRGSAKRKRGLPSATALEKPLAPLLRSVAAVVIEAAEHLARDETHVSAREGIHSLAKLNEWRALLLACVVRGPLDAESFAPLWDRYSSALVGTLDAAFGGGTHVRAQTRASLEARSAAAEISTALRALAPPWDPLLLLHGGRPTPPRSLVLGESIAAARAHCDALALSLGDAGYASAAGSESVGDDASFDINDVAARAAALQPRAAPCFAADAALRGALARGLCLVRQTATASSLDDFDATGESAAATADAEVQVSELVRLLGEQVAAASSRLSSVPSISTLPLQEEGWVTRVSGQAGGGGLPLAARAFPPELLRWGVCRAMQRDLQPLADGLVSGEALRVLARASDWLATGTDVWSEEGLARVRVLGTAAERLVRVAQEAATLPPSALAPAQQLAWLCAICVDTPAPSAGSDIARERTEQAAEVVHDLWVGLYQAVWGSALAVLPASSVRPPYAGDACTPEGASWDPADWSARRCAGPPRVYLSWATLCLRRILGGGGDSGAGTAVSSARAKAMQLRLAARYLCDALQSCDGLQDGSGAPDSSSDPLDVPDHVRPGDFRDLGADLSALGAQLAAVCRAHATAVVEGTGSREVLLHAISELAHFAAVGVREWASASSSQAAAAATGRLLGVLADDSACTHPGIAEAAREGGALKLALEAWHAAAAACTRGGDSVAGAIPEVDAFQPLLLAGRSWALLGALRLSLVVPPTPVDPAAKYTHECSSQSALEADAARELGLRDAIAREGEGEADIATIAELTLRRSQAEACAVAAARDRAPRPASPKYSGLHADLRRFSQSVASPAAVAAAVDAGGVGADDASVASACARADVLVSSATQLVERVSRTYATHYADVAAPAVRAALELRHGVALWSCAAAAQRSAEPASRGTLERAVVSLMSYPAGSTSACARAQGSLHPLVEPLVSGELHKAIAQLQSRRAETDDADADMGLELGASRAAERQRLDEGVRTARTSLSSRAGLLQVALERCSHALRSAPAGGADACLVGAHVATSRQLVSLWEEAKDAEARFEAERDSIYKNKPATHAAPDDDAMAEARFQRMFPDHTGDFADLLDAPDSLEASGAPQQLSGRAAAEAAARKAAVAAAAAEMDERAGRLRASIEDGEALRAVVRMHATVFGGLADGDEHDAGASSGEPDVKHKAGAAPRTSGAGRDGGSGDSDGGVDGGGARSEDESFVAAYDAAASLLPLLGDALPSALDVRVADGHVVRACLEHRRVLRGYYTQAAEDAARLDTSAGAAAKTRVHKGKRGMLSVGLPTMNINTDSNPSEAAMLGPMVVSVQERAVELLEEFEEHAVLQQLVAICVRVADLPLSAPLAKLLTGAELLLARAQLWEELAARHVSIAERLKPIELLVKRWRSIELKSWPGLLDTREAAASHGTAKWWLHMWSLFHTYVSGTESSDSVSLEEVSHSVEEFAQRATLGDFGSRVELLRAFEAEMRVLARMPGAASAEATGEHKHSSGRAATLAAVLGNAARYYERMADGVAAAISEARAPIEDELKGFCKLARWEDRNFYALKASADRAHYTLHKFTRKYDEALAEPAAAALNKTLEAVGAQGLAAVADEARAGLSGAAVRVVSEEELATRAREATDDAWRLFAASNASVLSRLAGAGTTRSTDSSEALYQHRLPHVLKTAQRLMLTSAGGSATGSSASTDNASAARAGAPIAVGAVVMDGLATAVIERAAALRAMGEAESDGQKRIARSAKRKALADLLRRLGEVGLGRRKGGARDPLAHWTARPVPNTERALGWCGEALVATGALSREEAVRAKGAATKGTRYYYAAIANMQALRAAYDGGHHPELSGREAAAGISAAEGLLERMQEQRSAMVEELGEFAQLDEALALAHRVGKHDCVVGGAGAARACVVSATSTAQACAQARACARACVRACDALIATDGEAASGGVAARASEDARAIGGALEDAGDALRYALRADGVRDIGDNFSNTPDVVSRALHSAAEGARAALSKARDRARAVPQSYAAAPCWSALACALNDAFADSTCDVGAVKAEVRDPADGGDGAVECVEECVKQVMLATQAVAAHRARGAAAHSRRQRAADARARAAQARERARPAAEAKAKGAEADVAGSDEPADASDEDEQAESVGTVQEWDADALALWSALRPARVAISARRALRAIASDVSLSPNARSERAAQLACLLAPLRACAFGALADFMAAHKAAGKLSYVLCNLFVSLCKEGFCTPQEQAEGDGADGKMVEGDGTGMADGTGTKDVGDEIDNEDQLMGTKDQEKQDQPEQQERDKDEEDKGVEMQQDFEGAMEDISEDEQEDADDDQEDGDDEDRLDDIVGEAGEDAEVVDEKLWDEKEDERTNPQDEKYEEGKTAQAGEQELEYRGKDDPDADDDADEKGEDKGEDKEKDEPEDIDVDEQQAGEEEGDAPDPDGPGVEQSHGFNLEQEEEMDLPENMQLDGDEAGEDDGDDAADGEDGEDEAGDGGEEDGKAGEDDGGAASDGGDDIKEDAAALDGEEKEEEADGEDQEGVQTEPAADEADQEDGEDEQPEGDEGGHDAREAGGEDEDEPEPEGEDNGDGVTAAGRERGEDDQENAAGAGTVDELPQGVDLPSAPQRADAASAAVATASGAQAGDGQRASGDQAKEAAGANAEMPEGDAAGDNATGEDDANEGRRARLQDDAGAREDAGGEQSQQRRDAAMASEANPYRSLGDATKQWRDALPMVADAVEAGEDEPEGADGDPEAEGDEFEFAGADDKRGGRQVMAAATEEQAAAQLKDAEDGEQEDRMAVDGEEDGGAEDADAAMVDADAERTDTDPDADGEAERGEAVKRRAQPATAADANARDAPAGATDAAGGVAEGEAEEGAKSLHDLLREDAEREEDHAADAAAAGDLALAKAVCERLDLDADVPDAMDPDAGAAALAEYRRSQAEGALQRAQAGGEQSEADMELWRSAWRKVRSLRGRAPRRARKSGRSRLRLAWNPKSRVETHRVPTARVWC